MRITVEADAEKIVRGESYLHEAVEELVRHADALCCASDALTKAKGGIDGAREIYPEVVREIRDAWEKAYKKQMQKMLVDVKGFLERVAQEDLTSPHGEGH